MAVEVTFDRRAVSDRLGARAAKAQKVLDAQVLKDSNYYIPKRDGDLERSSLASPIGSGYLIWDIEYARAQYHGLPNKSKDVNPNASTKWFERAKVVKLKEWEALANREYSK
jgi:hypothetical protein